MVSRIQTLDRALLRRRCVACGYDGSLLRNGLAPRCARCGCDLRKRPARSYVEMEGLGGLDERPQRPGDLWLEARLVHRWIAFTFLAMFGVAMLIYLSTAAFSV